MMFCGLIDLCLDHADAPYIAAYSERTVRDTIALMQTL